jgi:hypothetical protein
MPPTRPHGPQPIAKQSEPPEKNRALLEASVSSTGSDPCGKLPILFCLVLKRPASLKAGESESAWSCARIVGRPAPSYRAWLACRPHGPRHFQSTCINFTVKAASQKTNKAGIMLDSTRSGNGIAALKITLSHLKMQGTRNPNI